MIWHFRVPLSTELFILMIVTYVLNTNSLSLSETTESDNYNREIVNRVKRSPFFGGGFGVGVRFDSPSYMNIPGFEYNSEYNLVSGSYWNKRRARKPYLILPSESTKSKDSRDSRD